MSKNYFGNINDLNEVNVRKNYSSEKSNENKNTILQDKSIGFHGIGYDIMRLKSILEHGILSQEEAQERNVHMDRNYKGYNLNDSISVAQSPSIDNTYILGAFRCYIKEFISLVIKDVNTFKSLPGSSIDSGIIDERYVRNQIGVNSIKGIMLPEEMLDRNLSQVPIGLSHMEMSLVDDRCLSLINQIEKECDIRVNKNNINNLIQEKRNLEILNLHYFKKFKKEKSIIGKMDDLTQGYIEKGYEKKIGVKKPTLRDALKLYVPEYMKIYNIEGEEINIKENSLKHNDEELTL